MTIDNHKITAIKAFSDNYIWAITTTNTSAIALVDPGDADVCLDFIKQNQLRLTTILITHHHNDHIGGIEKLQHYCKTNNWPLTIYGPANENIPGCDVLLKENDVVELTELAITFKVLDIPGHTLGHIAYVNETSLFCGDTLFSGGCGRIFEGTPEQMYQSLAKLSALPNNTKVYCAHEYTQANVTFALTVDPENMALVDYFNKVTHLREQSKSTIPTNIATEKQINPFFRCSQVALVQSAQHYTNKELSAGLATFTAIREWKNNF